MGFLALILGCALVALTAALVAASLRLARAVDFLLAFYVVGAAELAVVALVVSPIHELTRGGLLAVAAVLFALAAVVWQLRSRPSPPSLRTAVGGIRDACRDPVVAALAVAVSLAVGYAVVLSIATPPNDYDALWYHLARAAFWRQQHAVSYISGANDLRLNVFPPVAEITSAWTMVLDGSERYASLFEVLALLALLVSVAGIARRVGLDRRAALLGALLFATLPVVVLQAGTPLNDLTVASFLVVTVYFLLSDGRLSLPLSALSLALAVGTKATALLALPILLLIAAVLCPRRRLGLAIVAGLAGIIVGSFWYVVNFVEKGNALPRFAPLDEKRIHAPEHIRLPAHLARLVIDAVDPAGSVGRDRWLYALGAAVLLVLGVFAVRRGRSSAGLVAVSIASALVLVPLLVPFVHDKLLRGYQRAFLHINRPDVAFLGSTRAARPPSPFVSWYGPLGILLAFAGLVFVIREVRRGRLRPGTIVLPLAPFLYFVLVAAGIGYSPFHGRYFVSVVALAAATWGLVATVRPIAWAAGAIAVVTLLLSVIHYAEKPLGVNVLGGSAPRSIWQQSRLEAFGAAAAPGGGAAVATLDRLSRAGDRVALAIRQDDVSYPYFGGRLDRKVVFLGKQQARNDMDWLVEAPGFDVVPCRSGWRRVPLDEPGWQLYRRSGVCGETSP